MVDDGKPQLSVREIIDDFEVEGALLAGALGVISMVIALNLVLPLPFANILPAISLAVLAMGVIRRDGLLVLGGYLLSPAPLR